MPKHKLPTFIGIIAGMVLFLESSATEVPVSKDPQTARVTQLEENVNQRNWWQVSQPSEEHYRVDDRTLAKLNPTDLDSFILATMNTYHIPGVAACVVKDGQIIWTGAYGHAIIEQDVPVADTTLFMLASISKTFTGAALLQLWEAGLFELDDDINDYLPFAVFNPNHPESVITFRELLTHTSSIKDNWEVMLSVYAWGDSPIPLGDYVEGYLTPGGEYYSATANFYTWAPEHGWSYCNEAFALVAYLVEVISGTPFDQYCNDSLFTPLGMYETSWFLADLDTNNVAMPYHYGGGTYVPQGYYGYADYPAGQLRTSSIELARHLIAFLQKGEIDGIRILDSATVEEMTTIQYPNLSASQGLVWFHNYVGGRWVWRHGGGDAGVATLASCCPDENSAVVVLTNGESHSATGNITNLLFDYAASHTVLVGDANGDGAIDAGDVVHLISYLFRSGPAPIPYEAGDCDSNSVVDSGDIVYLLNYLYRNGPPPGEA